MTTKTAKKPQRRKMFVAYLLHQGEPTIAGMTTGFTDAEARRLFAAERRVSARDVEVKWTGLRDVSFVEYCIACEAQADFLAG